MWLGIRMLTLITSISIMQGVTSKEEIPEDLRTKRQIYALPLIYPYGGTYKLLIGFTSPIPNKDQISLAFAANFQYQYLQFQNITMLSQYYTFNTISREQRDAEVKSDERLTFYRATADMLDAKGFNGHQCVLRAICEVAQYPVEEEGLIGEILHILLTPDYGHTPFDVEDPAWEEDMALYKDAAVAGRQMFDCGYVYNGCPEGQGVMEIISILRDE